jgi:hypothetical protein
MHLEHGTQVKCNPRTKYFFENIQSWKKREFGLVKANFINWKELYFVIKLKYKYCKEFREILEKYKYKVYCEDSFWGDNFYGVVFDNELGKYRGVNALGRVMKRVYLEREKIMNDASI